VSHRDPTHFPHSLFNVTRVPNPSAQVANQPEANVRHFMLYFLLGPSLILLFIRPPNELLSDFSFSPILEEPDQ
jgi:hypothetical protein